MKIQFLGLLVSLIATAANSGQVNEFMTAKEQAIHGDARAEYELGRRYEFGDGVNADAGKAVTWYRKAAEHEMAQAQYSLARMYMAGDRVAQNNKQAVKWLRRAAAHDYVLAKNRLGIMYERGLGVAKDEVEAYKWYILAAEGKNIAGIANRDKLAARLTRIQIAEAERKAATNPTEALVTER